jgi:hypothetical protein
MNGSTRPAVLLTELLTGEGPHQDLADNFVAAECVGCGGDVGRQGRVDDDRWWCPTCWARHSAMGVGDR